MRLYKIKSLEQEGWSPCARRGQVQMMGRDGTTVEVNRCAHTGCDKFTKDVTPADCETCIMRLETNMPVVQPMLAGNDRDFKQPTHEKDGSIVYPKTGWEPPTCPDGYRRKSEDFKSADAWVFIPMAEPCEDRKMFNGTKTCGCIKLSEICLSRTSGRYGFPVGPAECNSCPVRRLKEVHVEQGAINLGLGEAVTEGIVGTGIGDTKLAAEGLEPDLVKG